MTMDIGIWKIVLWIFCDWWKVEPGSIWLIWPGHWHSKTFFPRHFILGILRHMCSNLCFLLISSITDFIYLILYFVQTVCYIFLLELILHITQVHGQQHISLVYGREGQSGGAIMGKVGWAGIEIDMVQQLLKLSRAIFVTFLMTENG